eukprot:139397-Amphidinium_carterae.1
MRQSTASAFEPLLSEYEPLHICFAMVKSFWVGNVCMFQPLKPSNLGGTRSVQSKRARSQATSPDAWLH